MLHSQFEDLHPENDSYASPLRASKRLVRFVASPTLVLAFDDLDCPSSATPPPRSDFGQLKLRLSASAPYWMEDDRVQHSKIYAARLFRGAQLMQALTRGYLQRRLFYRSLVELRRREKVARRARLERERLAAEQRALDQAATEIQALVRGYQGRLRSDVVRLETRLARIEAKKRAQLDEIEAWKRRRLAEIQKTIDADIERHCAQKAQALVNVDRIEELRVQNKAIRQRHEKLRKDTRELRNENERLAMQNEVYRQGTVQVREALLDVMRTNREWQQVHDAYEAKVEEFQEAYDRQESFIALVKHHQRKFQTTTKHILNRIHDARLRDQIMQDLEDKQDKKDRKPRSPRHKKETVVV